MPVGRTEIEILIKPARLARRESGMRSWKLALAVTSFCLTRIFRKPKWYLSPPHRWTIRSIPMKSTSRTRNRLRPGTSRRCPNRTRKIISHSKAWMATLRLIIRQRQSRKPDRSESFQFLRQGRFKRIGVRPMKAQKKRAGW